MTARITGTISATGFTDLTLGDTSVIQFPPDWLDGGISDFKRQTSAPPNVPGRVLGDRALDVVTFVATVRIGNSDGSTDAVTIVNTLGDLIDRVRTDDWHFTFTYDTATFEWVCEPAGVRPQFGRLLLGGFMPVQLTVPRNPIPVQGPF